MNRDEWLAERTAHYQTRCCESEQDTKRRELLASQLAKHFETGRGKWHCAECDAPLCCHADCNDFWIAVLKMKPDWIERAFGAFFIAVGEQ